MNLIPAQLFYRRPLVAALLSAGLLLCTTPARALNIVGYVNAPLTNGYNFIANPLDFPPNVLTNLIPSPPNGSRAYFWDVTNQVFLPTATYGPTAWNRNYDFPVGCGVVVYVPIKYTNTFVGSVTVPSSQTLEIAGSNRFSLVACKLPIGGPISLTGTNAIAFPQIDGATAHFFRKNQTFDSFTCFTNFGWFAPQGGASTEGPNLNVGESFFVQNPGPTTNWVTTAARPAPPSLMSPDIKRISIQGGTVTLNISSPVAYDVQFSLDGGAWTTIAANQSGRSWTGPLPDPLQAQFRVIRSQTEGGVK